MCSVKATLIFSLTTLILLASYIAYNSHHERFLLIPSGVEKSIYVFDRKNNVLNRCTVENQCVEIKLNLPLEQESHESILPASLLRLVGRKSNTSAEVVDPKSAVTVAAVQVQAAAPVTVPVTNAVPVPVATSTQAASVVAPAAPTVTQPAAVVVPASPIVAPIITLATPTAATHG